MLTKKDKPKDKSPKSLDWHIKKSEDRRRPYEGSCHVYLILYMPNIGAYDEYTLGHDGHEDGRIDIVYEQERWDTSSAKWILWRKDWEPKPEGPEKYTAMLIEWIYRHYDARFISMDVQFFKRLYEVEIWLHTDMERPDEFVRSMVRKCNSQLQKLKALANPA